MERLDFTVIGPAVNEVSRIAAMCRSVDQSILVSDGRYALRGVGRAQELFTLDPEFLT
jgi:adenylate cyclase